MAKTAVFNTDTENNRVTYWHEEDGKVFLESKQDVTPIQRAAKILSEEPPGKDFRRVALIPQTVMTQAMNEGWFHDEDAWKRWANDPANVGYRTWQGKI